MATLKERLARLEAKTTTTTPIDIEFHIVSVVTSEDERCGTWHRNTEDLPYPCTTFYAASVAEFEALRDQHALGLS